MRERAVLSRGDDRRERGLGAELPQARLAGTGDITLGSSGEAALQHPLIDTVGELSRRRDALELVGLLDDPQLLDQIAGGNQTDVVTDGRLQPGELADAQLRVLEADPAGHPGGDLRDQLPLRLRALPLGRDLVLGPLGVAEVGEEDELVGTHEAGAVRAGETGQVADVDQVRDEELIEFLLGDQLGQAPTPRHIPSLFAISSSASR